MAKVFQFELGNKAESLYFSVFDATTNRSHYPVRENWDLIITE